MKVGSVNTEYHNVDLKIRTSEMIFESEEEDNISDTEEKEAESSMKETETESEPEQKKVKVDKKPEKEPEISFSQETQMPDEDNVSKLSKEVSGLTFKQKTDQEIEEELYIRCLGFILVQEVVTEELISNNLKYSKEQCTKFLDRAKKEKIVSTRYASKKKGYCVIKSTGNSAKRDQIFEMISKMEKNEKVVEEKKEEKKEIKEDREGSLSPVFGEREKLETPKKDTQKSQMASPKELEEMKETPTKRKLNELEDSQNDPFDFEKTKVSTVNNPIAQKKRKMYRDVKKITM